MHPRHHRRDAGGQKELVGFTDGTRESAHDWRELLLDLKRRGLDVQPELMIADGALGFWKAAGEVWPTPREQRCWVHKTANVLNKLPKSQQPKAKRALQEIWMAETKAAAETAFDAFIESYSVKYEKAADCLAKDRDALLAFYDFPAEHWKHLRTTNPIESTFATVRHRTIRSKGCLSNKTALAMVFKLVEGAQKSWRRLDGHAQLPKLILGVKFADGLEVAPKKAAELCTSSTSSQRPYRSGSTITTCSMGINSRGSFAAGIIAVWTPTPRRLRRSRESRSRFALRTRSPSLLHYRWRKRPHCLSVSARCNGGPRPGLNKASTPR